MRVLQINKYFYRKGGSETVFFNTIQLLEQHGHTVIPFSVKNKKNNRSIYESYFVDYSELSEVGFIDKIKALPSFFYNKRAAKQLECLLQDEKPDIAHIHLMFNSLSVSILKVLKKYNVPVVMSVHDYRLVCPAYIFMDRKGDVCERCLKKESYWRCVTNRCSKGNFLNSVILSMDSYFRKYFFPVVYYIDKFIFVSKFCRNKFIEANVRYETKSSLIYNFTPSHISRKIEKKDYILYLGRVSREKGIPTLMKAMENLPMVKLKIAGTGPLLDKYKENSNSNIDFIGYKTGKELEEYIQKALFVIVPSEWYENNPLSIIESYSMGTPVIGSRIGGIPELIQENKNGFLFEPKSVVELQEKIQMALVLSSNEYLKMCNEALSFAEKYFSEEVHYEKLISVYNNVLKER